MRVDLHCHTKSTKKGDGDGRNVTKDLFVQKVSDADVKIVAITNHNAFDIKQYYELKEAVAGFCQVWPGIEIDIQGKENKYHMIVVANPDNVEQFSKSIEELFNGKDIETCRIAVGEVYSKLNDCDVIYITHLGKTPSITDEEYKELVDLVGDESRVFGETQNNRSLGVFANHNYNVIIGSDVKDWTKYQDSTFAELKLPVDSFKQFCLLSKKDKIVVDTLLNKKQSYELVAKPHTSVSFKLKIFRDVNIIFGQKGTGKTEIIKSLCASMTSLGINCSQYIASENDSNFKSLLNHSDMQLDLDIVKAYDCKVEFENIKNWCDYNPTPFSKYLDWYTTRENNKRKSKMKITESQTMLLPDSEIRDTHKRDFDSAKKLVVNYEDINSSDYLDEEDKNQFDRLVSKLKQTIQSTYAGDLVDEYATQLANFTINKIKEIADRKSDSQSKPSTTGFKEFASRRLSLKKDVQIILNNISDKENHDKVFLGEIEGKGKIYIDRVHRMLCDQSKKDDYDGSVINALRKAKEYLVSIKNHILDNELPNNVAEFNTHCQNRNISSSISFLGRLKTITKEDGTVYNPSTGEKAILMLQRELRKNVDAFFLDEPELGMGNSYINNTICPQIIKLAQSNKIIVIATHNANIAVRSLPYTSIFRTHQNGKYNTYVGNPFNNLLVNIDDATDVKGWAQESMLTLEGGKEAFYEREFIYESNN